MSRIRTIKPEFWTSEQVVECSFAARLLFIGMWNFADDGGNLPASIKTVKMQVLPSDNVDMDALISELIGQGLIVSYEAEGKTYWNITGWKHQKISNPSYKYPSLEKKSEKIASHREPSREIASPLKSYPPEGKGREGNIDSELSNESSAASGDGLAVKANGLDEDPKAVLFGPGVEWLAKETGKSPPAMRSAMGKLLSEAGGDAYAGMVLGLLRDAKRERKAEPLSWLMRMARERRTQRAPPGTSPPIERSAAFKTSKPAANF